MLSSTFSLLLLPLLVLASILTLGSALSNDLTSQSLVVVRQDEKSNGHIEALDPTIGLTIAKSNLAPFPFTFPLAEMTMNKNTNDIYIVTYPTGQSGPSLYRLDKNLQVAYSYPPSSQSFFDLQYSPLQDYMFGILVTSTYGRALSQFNLDESNGVVTPTELFTLPYMWYVNASAFAGDTSCHYFAILNNFPGFANSTTDQQLLVGQLAYNASLPVNQPIVNVYPLTHNSDLIVQFVAYSPRSKILYTAGMNGDVAQVSGVDYTTGKVYNGVSFFERKAVAVGPLTFIPSTNGSGDLLTIFIQTSDSPEPVWEMYTITVESGASFGTAQLHLTNTGSNYEHYVAATVVGLKGN